MIEAKLVERLNEQINLEFYSSNLYLQMSSWCEREGLDGCAGFLRAHADEEMGHMRRIFDYVNGTGALARLGAIDEPPAEFDGVGEIFRQALEHEILVSERIDALASDAFESKDYSTFHFLQWFVSEQHEEEKLFRHLNDRIEIIGTEGKGLFYVDREVGRMTDAPSQATSG